MELELGLSCCSIHFDSPICLRCSMSPRRGPLARRFSACKIASSALSSVIGRPLSAASCFGFLSVFITLLAMDALSGGVAAAGEKSPKEIVHSTESVCASNDFGVAEIEGRLKRIGGNPERKPGARNFCSLIVISCPIAAFGGHGDSRQTSTQAGLFLE